MPPHFSDRLVSLIGTWKFLVIQSIVLLAHVIAGTWFGYDAYPFIFLNLLLSFQAAYTAPIIMMSQNRMAAFDRDLAKIDRENTKRILEAVHRLERVLIKQVDSAIDEISDAVEEIKDAVEELGDDDEDADSKGPDGSNQPK